MKIIHRDYGYQFDCSIKGKIEVTRREWAIIKKYLLRSKSWHSDNYDNRPILRRDLERSIDTEQGRLFNIRVPATDAVIQWFGTVKQMKQYKRQNYMFLVKNTK